MMEKDRKIGGWVNDRVRGRGNDRKERGGMAQKREER
jgi:hypothetical protein